MRTTPSNDVERSGAVTIENLTRSEVEAIGALILGAGHVHSEHRFDGSLRLVGAPYWATFPDPVEDPFWGDSGIHSGRCDGVVAQYETTHWGPGYAGWHSPAFIIQHLMPGPGYIAPGSEQEALKRAARNLQDFGFVCLRSRRGADGRYWQVWYLPGLYAARGALGEFVKTSKLDKWDGPGPEWYGKASQAVDFLCARFVFGSLEVVVQRAALSYE